MIKKRVFILFQRNFSAVPHVVYVVHMFWRNDNHYHCSRRIVHCRQRRSEHHRQEIVGSVHSEVRARAV